MSKTAGYIVVCLGRGLMEYNPKNEQGLCFSGCATLFPTLYSAQRAITLKLRQLPTFENKFGKLAITRVVETELQ